MSSQSRASMIRWTDYLKYRAKIRGFDLVKLEHVIRHSTERYRDTETGRLVVVGRHDEQLVMIPYDIEDEDMTPVTVHAITRQQLRFRLSAGRFTYE